jgi:hypothetical protein
MKMLISLTIGSEGPVIHHLLPLPPMVMEYVPTISEAEVAYPVTIGRPVPSIATSKGFSIGVTRK